MTENELYHHGILGMHWGIRRYQNKNGSLTQAGKQRYSNKEIREDEVRFRNEARTNAPENIKQVMNRIVEFEKRADYLSSKYKFDPDDGGGAETKKDERAAKEYMNLMGELDKLTSQLGDYYRKYTNDRLMEKYGEKRLKQLKATDTAAGIAVATAVLGVTAFSLSSPKNFAISSAATAAAAAAAIAAYSVKRAHDRKKKEKKEKKEA